MMMQQPNAPHEIHGREHIGLNSNHVVGFQTIINNPAHNESMLDPEFKLLTAFMHGPSKELYGRQIERMAGTTHERSVTYLKSLVNAKILSREKKGNQVFYRLNRQNEIVQKALAFAELERKINFIKGNKEGFIVQDLVLKIAKEYRSSIYFILLFGSVARGHQREESDIDLLFVLLENGKTREKIGELVKTQEMLTGKKVSFHPVTIRELEKLWSKEPVYKNIWDERVVFFGEENFWNFVLKEGEPHARQTG